MSIITQRNSHTVIVNFTFVGTFVGSEIPGPQLGRKNEEACLRYSLLNSSSWKKKKDASIVPANLDLHFDQGEF